MDSFLTQHWDGKSARRGELGTVVCLGVYMTYVLYERVVDFFVASVLIDGVEGDVDDLWEFLLNLFSEDDEHELIDRSDGIPRAGIAVGIDPVLVSEDS